MDNGAFQHTLITPICSAIFGGLTKPSSLAEWDQISKDGNLSAGTGKSAVDESERASKDEGFSFGGGTSFVLRPSPVPTSFA